MSFATQQPLPVYRTSRAATSSAPVHAARTVADRFEYPGSVRNAGHRGNCHRGHLKLAQAVAKVWQPGKSMAVLEDKSFARKRIHHAMEMFGACMMMAVFLALAIFS